MIKFSHSPDNILTKAVDLWSFGICILELANGKPPHRSSALRAMFTAGTVGKK